MFLHELGNDVNKSKLIPHKNEKITNSGAYKPLS